MGDTLTTFRGDYTPNAYQHKLNGILSRQAGKINKCMSYDSAENGINDEFGWFDDIESNVLTLNGSNRVNKPGSVSTMKTLSLPLPKTNPPSYVLESRVETQHLWYETAGQRPQQPRHEREYFESIWKRNFENSGVDYPTSTKKPQDIDEDENLRVDVDDGVIINRGRGQSIHSYECVGCVRLLNLFAGPFSISVSKSFLYHSISSVTLQVILVLII